MENQAVTFRLPKALYESLRQEAFETRRSMNELVAEAIAARITLIENGGGIDHLDGNPRNNDPENLDVWEKLIIVKTSGEPNATERAVWAEWNALPEDDPSPVKRIAKKLGMEPVDVAFVVYPAEAFGRWEDDHEPDLDDADD
jgi:hypothetical protein